MDAQVLALVKQKGGVTKSTSCVNLAAGQTQAGKKMAVVDCNSQASMTISLGYPQPDRLPVTLTDMMGKVFNDQSIVPARASYITRRDLTSCPPTVSFPGWRFRW